MYQRCVDYFDRLYQEGADRPRVPPGATEYTCDNGRRLYVRFVDNGKSAWVILFAWTGTYGNLGSFMHALASSMKLAPAVLTSVALLLPVLLAWPAARVGAGLRPESRATASDRVIEGRPAL